jgi:hypothetical protein
VSVRGRRLGGASCAVLLAAAAACGADPEPLLSATCAADGAMEHVICTIRNQGKKASRACFRARLRPPAGDPIIARRVCTKVLEPDGAAEVTVPFEPLGRIQPAELLTQCIVAGQWACKMDVLETPREMTENQPKPRP